MKSFFLVFLLAHLVGDFVLQTNKIALLKLKGIRGVSIHVAIVTISQCILLGVLYNTKYILLGIGVGVIHFVIDYIKKTINPYIKKVQTLYFIFDQVLHISIIYLASYFFYSGEALKFVAMETVAIIIGLTMAYYVTTIMAKTVLFDLNLQGEGQPFFRDKERVIDGLYALMIFVAGSRGWLVALSVSAIMGGLYFITQKRLMTYSNKVIGLKALVILISVGTLVIFL